MPTNSATNAGVQAITGFEFQSNCAIFLILDDYDNIKDLDYFLSMEHHEDFLFCFFDGNGEVERITTYQAKKASSRWTLTNEFHELLEKMVDNGLAIRADSIVKSAGFALDMHFISNYEIKLTVGQGNSRISRTVNETEIEVQFLNLEQEIQDAIKNHTIFSTATNKAAELDNVRLCFIDLNRTVKAQKERLIGKIVTVLKGEVYDPSAALETLLSLFDEVKAIFNQGNIPKLFDLKKRVTSEQINEAFDVITSKKRAFKIWRDNKSHLCSSLNIKIPERNEFEQHFDYSLDLFKDKTQVHHMEIRNFVENSDSIIANHVDDSECLEELYNEFIGKHFSRLKPIQIKAALFAAYIQKTYQ